MPNTALSEAHRSLPLPLRQGEALSWQARPLIMGVLNITPDSFSDGGLWIDPAAAVAHALEMVAQGADILDLGAESTRPGGGVYGQGAEPISAEVELDRLLPVLEAVRPKVPVPISVDTRKGRVAAAALDAGADMINDISALSDPDLGAAVSAASCPVILMHSRGQLPSMQQQITFNDVAVEVTEDLSTLVKRALSCGVMRDQILIDPGIGFGKTAQQNLELLRRLDVIRNLDLPLVVGASRKSFIGEIAGTQAAERLSGSLAAVSWAAHHGAAVVRVHDVADTHQFLQVWKAIESA